MYHSLSLTYRTSITKMIQISKVYSGKIPEMLNFFKKKKCKNLFFQFSLITILFCLVIPLFFASGSFRRSEASTVEEGENWQLTLLKAWKNMNGSDQYGLFVELKDGWKTYWRNPGDSGFVPEFQILKSKNLDKLEVYWPTPQIFYENENEIYGFSKKLILPIVIHPQKKHAPAEFQLKITLGFCKDICIPKTFHLKSKNLQNTSEHQNREILKSISKVPVNLSNSKKFIFCTVFKDGEKLKLVSQLDSEYFKANKRIKDIIFQYKDGSVWFTNKTQGMDQGIQTFQTTLNHVNNKKILVDRSKIELTLLTQDGGFIVNGCLS